MVFNLFSKEKFFISLDIGTETIKAVFFKKDAQSFYILKSYIDYFQQPIILNESFFNQEMIRKMIFKMLNSFKNDLLLSTNDRKLIERQKKWDVIVSISPDKFKARVVNGLFIRENYNRKISKEEEKIIFEEVIEKAKKKITNHFAKQFKVFPIDVYINSVRILEMKIDGYEVFSLVGYKGKLISFNILISFMLRYYLDGLLNVLNDLNLNFLKLVHLAENFSLLYNNKKDDYLLIDVGGKVTQFVLVKKEKIFQIDEFERGGYNFSKILSDSFGIREETARILKEEYSRKFFSFQTEKRIEKLFEKEKEKWFLSLKESLAKMNRGILYFSNIYFLGGGSLLPDINKWLDTSMNSNIEELIIFEKAKIDFFSFDFKNIRNINNDIKNPQMVLPLINIIGNF